MANDTNFTLRVMESPITSVWSSALLAGTGEARDPARITTGLARAKIWLAVGRDYQARANTICSACLAEISFSNSQTRLSNRDTLSVSVEQQAQAIITLVYQGCVDCGERQESSAASLKKLTGQLQTTQ